MENQPKHTKVNHAAGQAVRRSQDYFRRTQYPEGYWWGELESNPTMEAEYLMPVSYTHLTLPTIYSV